MSDNVNHPKHYKNHPSGVECLAYDRLYDFYLIHDDFGFFKFLNDVLFGHESDLNDAIKYINNLIES